MSNPNECICSRCSLIRNYQLNQELAAFRQQAYLTLCKLRTLCRASFDWLLSESFGFKVVPVAMNSFESSNVEAYLHGRYSIDMIPFAKHFLHSIQAPENFINSQFNSTAEGYSKLVEVLQLERYYLMIHANVEVTIALQNAMKK